MVRKVYTIQEYEKSDAGENGEMSMKQPHKPRVLLLYKDMIPSVRLCGHVQLTYLDQAGEVSYRHRPIQQVQKADLNWAEIALFCRSDNPYALRLARALKQSDRQVGYIVDDDLLNVPMDLVSGAYFAQKDVQRSIRALMDESDILLSPSPVLLDQYAKADQRRILLEEPAIDPLPYAPRRDGPVRIGFAGSVDRTGDIERILRQSMLRIHQEYGKAAEFVFFGATPSFAQALEARCIPYCDSYDAYRSQLNELQMDIGLAPMPDTAFHACKHYNKFVEYAAAGAVGIFSDVKPYDRIRSNFDWPLLCHNTSEDWYQAMKRLLDHPEALDSYRRRAAELAAGPFSVPASAQRMAADLTEAQTDSVHQPVRVYALGLQKAAAQARRAFNGVRRYGSKAPALIWKRLRQ